MIPLWFLPYAVACGNTVIVKPSERVPLSMMRIFELMGDLGLPPGVVNLVNGSKAAVDAILDHPKVRAISFVGSTPVARYVYARGSANGKRVQAQGGAKNYVVVMPDADLETTTQIITDSAFGCAGQRCLAVSVAVTVGEARSKFEMRSSIQRVRSRSAMDWRMESGWPVITAQTKDRITGLIGQGRPTAAACSWMDEG